MLLQVESGVTGRVLTDMPILAEWAAEGSQPPFDSILSHSFDMPLGLGP